MEPQCPVDSCSTPEDNSASRTWVRSIPVPSFSVRDLKYVLLDASRWSHIRRTAWVVLTAKVVMFFIFLIEILCDISSSYKVWCAAWCGGMKSYCCIFYTNICMYMWIYNSLSACANQCRIVLHTGFVARITTCLLLALLCHICSILTESQTLNKYCVKSRYHIFKNFALYFFFYFSAFLFSKTDGRGNARLHVLVSIQ